MSISDTITKLNPYFIRRVLKINTEKKNCTFNINLCKCLETIFQNILELLVTHHTIDHWLYNFGIAGRRYELAILDNSALENSLQEEVCITFSCYLRKELCFDTGRSKNNLHTVVLLYNLEISFRL